ncbi:MAG: preprotein translocase subunit SecY, partial [Candidatus Gastranaerophilaceae bacterium]
MQQPKIQPPSVEDLKSMFKISGLKQKLIFTVFVMIIFRFCTQIPLFGINNLNFLNIAGGENIIGFLDMFSGGALGNVSIIALGIGPYITSSIVMQLLAVVVPHLEQLQKEEGEAGRRKISQYTRLFTVVIAIFQSLVFVLFLTRNAQAALLPGINPVMFIIGSVFILTTGAVFTMWLAELMTEKGIGNGASMIIFWGILSRIPFYFEKTAKIVVNEPALKWGLIATLIIFFATMVLIVIMHEAARKIIIVNPKRQVGNKVYGGMNTYIPFKLNPGGVMPIIFAVAILFFPTTVLELVGKSNFPAGPIKDALFHLSGFFNTSTVTYSIVYFLLIVVLTFFYASIIPNMQPKEIANNLKKYGSSIPGIKPGRPTAEALDRILSRITLIGAFGLGIIALIPTFTAQATNITTLQGLGATSLIIMV